MWPLALAAAGTALNAYGKYRAGDSAKKRANFEAKQMESEAGQRLAASQRQAQEYERQGRLQASRALAIAAASGGGAMDPTVVDIMGDLAGESNYRKMVALYEGEEQANKLRMGAESRREEGDLAKEAGKIGVLGTALSGGTSLYSIYGMTEDRPAAMSIKDKLTKSYYKTRYPGNEWANAPGPRKLKK